MFEQIVNDSFDTAHLLKKHGYEIEKMTSEEVNERILAIKREADRIEAARKD